MILEQFLNYIKQVCYLCCILFYIYRKKKKNNAGFFWLSDGFLSAYFYVFVFRKYSKSFDLLFLSRFFKRFIFYQLYNRCIVLGFCQSFERRFWQVFVFLDLFFFLDIFICNIVKFCLKIFKEFSFFFLVLKEKVFY